MLGFAVWYLVLGTVIIAVGTRIVLDVSGLYVWAYRRRSRAIWGRIVVNMLVEVVLVAAWVNPPVVLGYVFLASFPITIAVYTRQLVVAVRKRDIVWNTILTVVLIAIGARTGTLEYLILAAILVVGGVSMVQSVSVERQAQDSPRT